MTGRQAVALVARREITERVRERSFLVSIAVTIVLVVAVVLVPQLLGIGGDDEFEVGLVGDAAEPYAEVLPALAPQFDVEVTTRRLPSRRAGVTALREETVDAVVADDELLTAESEGDQLVALAQATARQVRAVARLDEFGVPPAEALEVLAPEPLTVLDPTAGDEGGDRSDAGFGVSFLVVFVLYGQILVYALAVGSGIVEEKSTRVVEILLATIRPAHLLAGKIIGVGLVGLLQLMIMAGVGLGVVLATGVVDIPAETTPAIVQGFLWFLLGYTFYSCAYATASSLVSRQEELQNVTSPLTLLVLGAFFVSFGALDDPDSTIARVGSFIPPFAPLVVPARAGAVSGVETAAAAAVTLAASVLLVPLAARVYAGAVLRTGSRVKLGQALRGGR